MKKMRTKGTALLVLVMMLFAVVGCTPAELGYLDLSKQVSEMTTVAVDEQIAINLTGNKLDALTGLELGNHLDVRATGKMDMKTMAFDLELSYRTGTTGAYQPLTRMAMDKDVMYLSTQGIWTLVKQYASEQFTPEYIAEMDAYIAAHPFLQVDAMTEEEAGGIDMDAYYEEVMKWSYGVLDIMAKYHEGFSTDLITEKDGGYAINATGDDLIALADSWLTFMQKDNAANSYAMISEILTSMQAMMKAGGLDLGEMALTQEQWQQGLAQVAAGWSELKTELTKTPISDKDYYQAFSKMTGSKGNRVVTSTEEINIDELGLNVATKATTTEIKGTIAPRFNATDIDTYAADIAAINARYTTVNSVVITPAEDGIALAEINQTFCDKPLTNSGFVELQYVDDRYHIGVDTLANALPGAVVDVTDNQATVTFNGKSASMAVVTAADIDGEEVRFVALRDLGQLGINIAYEGNPEKLTLTVE